MGDHLQRGRAEPAGVQWDRVTTRGIAAAMVLGLHLIVVRWIFLDPLISAHRTTEDLSLVLLPGLPSVELARGPARGALAAPAPTVLRPEPVAPSLRLPDLPPPAPLYSSAAASDVGQLMRICGGARQRRSRTLDDPTVVELLVRVEADGRVSDIATEAGADSQEIDPAADHCLRLRAMFTPNRIEGEPVASWQVLQWPAETAGRDR